MNIGYLSINDPIPPRDMIYLKALRKKGHQIETIIDNNSGFSKIFKITSKLIRMAKKDIIWVGYTSPTLVPVAYLLRREKVFFNAFSSFYESMILSRKVGPVISFKSLKYWLLDFFSFQLANLIATETNNQKKFIAKTFFVSPKKMIRVWTGADDEFFFVEPELKKNDVFTVVFRGGFLPEAGVPILLEAIKKLKNRPDIKFKIIGYGLEENKIKDMIRDYDLKVELITEKQTMDQLRKLIQPCHLSLGQLANHERLKRTIPHKAFEFLAMNLPYLTARTEGILELLEEDKTCFCFKPGDSQDLAEKIIFLKDHPEIVKTVSCNSYSLYRTSLTSDILANNLINSLEKI